MKNNLVLKIVGIILGVIVLFLGVTAVISVIGNNKNMERVNTFEKVEIENQLHPIVDENGYYTFVTDEDFKVVQLTDIHIGAGWLSFNKDFKALNAIASMVTAEKPDLVVVTGDTAYPVPIQAGTANNLSSARLFATLMEKLGVYWVLAFGNHDTEKYSYYDRAEIADFYENSGFKYCLFKSGPEDVDGYCNNVINVKNSKGEITQSIFTFDSHSYIESDIFGIGWKYDNIHENQVEWYRDCIEEFTEYNRTVSNMENPVPKSTAFFHIPLVEYQDAWYEYIENGFKDTENVKYIHGVAGEDGIIVFPGVNEDSLFETMVELGSTKGIFCGHDHENNFCVEYKGIRLAYGMSVDYLAYVGISKRGAQRGCTVITYSPDGSFTSKNENYYQDKYVPLYEKEEVNMEELTQLAAPEE